MLNLPRYKENRLNLSDSNTERDILKKCSNCPRGIVENNHIQNDEGFLTVTCPGLIFWWSVLVGALSNSPGFWSCLDCSAVLAGLFVSFSGLKCQLSWLFFSFFVRVLFSWLFFWCPGVALLFFQFPRIGNKMKVSVCHAFVEARASEQGGRPFEWSTMAGWWGISGRVEGTEGPPSTVR